MKFLRRLLPILSSSFHPPPDDKLLSKIVSNLDYYLPFRQHGPSLKNARLEIYSDIDRLASEDGIGFFNILAFRGVFFGSPFAQSPHYRWFESLSDWEHFYDSGNGNDDYDGEEYYVRKTCYGQAQTGRQLSLLPSYWEKRLLWNDLFKKSEKPPTVKQVFRWLTSSSKITKSTLFPNIGSLTALLICGDLVEAGILPMPSAKEWADSIAKMGKGSKAGMEKCGLVGNGCSREEFCMAFSSLDQALEAELSQEEKDTMGYNSIMLEHTLCKINRIGVVLF